MQNHMNNLSSNNEKATFAGGCFWCLVPPFQNLEGVGDIKTGYIGGRTPCPTYEEVCTGETGHYEAVQITFDPQQVSYEELLNIFWRQIDPTDFAGQFADRGSQYRTAIFYHSPQQRQAAEKSKEELERASYFSTPIVTEIIKALEFYPAEDYHQDYYLKNPIHYQSYKISSGREAYIKSQKNND